VVTGGSDTGAGTGSAPGARFGRFVVLGALGAGGMGVVMSAFDPELDRKVALKLLHPRVGAVDDARVRLQREAQAMARLAHPNAVTIYEVGRAGEHLFIAMELVDGTTLRGWLRDGVRSWREILALCVAAGRGLEAAHAAGMVHRDFKPENVLIGRDGRPQVSDFGLAESGLHRDGDSLGVAGTPSYMAPEQWLRGELDARTDQFAFCVALWTALYHQAPFVGETAAELREAVLANRRRPPPAAVGVPSWLAPILDRGLSIDASKRWPSMTVLLGELERRASARRRGWIGLGATALVASAAALTIAMTGRHAAPVEVCPAPTARLDPVWGPPRRESLRQHLAGIDAANGALRFAAAAAVFDRGGREWSAMHVSTCRATRVEGRQSDTVLDARMGCLDRWLEGLTATVTGLAQATDPDQLEGAIKSVAAIGSVDGCADATAVVAAADLPTAPAARAEAQRIVQEAMACNLARKAGHVDGLAARVDALIARARVLGHPGTLAKTLAVRWRLAVGSTQASAALAIMSEQTEVAARAHNDHEAARTWALMARLTAQWQGQPDEARVMIVAARSAAAHAGDPAPLVAEVLGSQADVEVAAGDSVAAQRAIVEARGLLVSVGADQPGSSLKASLGALLQTEGEQRWASGDLDGALASLHQSVAMLDDAYGPDTMEAAGVYLDLGQVLRDQGKLDEALVAVEHSIAVRGRHDAHTAALATALSVRAAIHGEQGHLDRSIADGERALALASAALLPNDLELLGITSEVALAYRDAGRLDEALALYVQILAITDRDEVETSNVGSWWVMRAEIEEDQHRCSVGLPHYARAIALTSSAQARDDHAQASALRGQGRCQLALGRTAAAISSLERAIAGPAPSRPDVEDARARGLLGKLLVDGQHDRGRGLALVREAVATLDAAHQPDAALVAWLARH